MNRFPRAALLAQVFVLFGMRDLSAAPRTIPGFSFGDDIDTHDVVIPTENGREPMDPNNDVAQLHPSLSADDLRLESSPRAGRTSRAIFPSTWWPMRNEGIAARWNSNLKDYNNWKDDRLNLAPTEKYDLLFYSGQTQCLEEFRAYAAADLR